MGDDKPQYPYPPPQYMPPPPAPAPPATGTGAGAGPAQLLQNDLIPLNGLGLGQLLRN